MHGRQGVVSPVDTVVRPRLGSSLIVGRNVRVSRAAAEAPSQTRFAVTEQGSKPGLPTHSVNGTATQHRRETATKATVESTNPVVNFWSTYQQKVETDPVPTKALTSFLGFVIGDFLAQKIEGREYDALRCLRLGAYGLFLDGPIGHWWYTVLDRYVEPQDPRGTKAVLLKTAADQVIWAPVMTCVFFAVLKSLEGHPELVWPTIQDKLIKTVAANYLLWPAAHIINFRFVPTEHRILYNNLVSIAWTCYLSTLAHVPVVDVDELSGQLQDVQNQLFDALPTGVQEQATLAAKAARETFKSALPTLDSLLQPGQHFGLDLTIPKQIEIRSSRMVPASFFLRGLGGFLGNK